MLSDVIAVDGSLRRPRLKRTVPDMSTGSCGRVRRELRIACRLILEMSMPSMVIEPCFISKSLAMVAKKALLPLNHVRLSV